MKTSKHRMFLEIAAVEALLGLCTFTLYGQPLAAPPGPGGPVNILAPSSNVESAFLEVNPINQLSAPSSPWSKKERFDRFNTLWLSAPSAKLELNLFDDARLPAVIDRFDASRGVGVFYGHLEGDEDASVLIAHKDGAIEARIRGPEGREFDVSYNGDGMHKITEVDPLKLRDTLRDDVLTKDGSTGNQTAEPSTPQTPDTSSPTIIDVMVLYTTEEKDVLGGQAATEARIALSVAYNNEAFRRSFVNARFRLVHTEEVTQSWHVPSHTAGSELSWLAGDSTVAQRRGTFGADLVSLLAFFTDYGGMAYCTSPHSVYSHYPEHFAHECAHNIGCRHERGNPEADCADQIYNYGYYFTSPVDGVQYGTIMSYVGSPCDLFSNPTNQFRGSATGIPEGQPLAADNARFINEHGANVAAWANQAVTVLSSPALINSGTQFTFQIAGPISGVYNVEYTGDYLSWATLGDFTLSSGSVSVTNTIGTNPYRFYRAKLGTAYLGTQVGYIKKAIPSGYSMLANQLDHDDNTFATLFPAGAVPDGITMYKYDENANPPGYVINYYDSLFGGWSSPWMLLNPGEGVMVNSPVATNLSFVGQVLPSFNRRVRTGLSIHSSAVPQAGAVSSVLRFPGVPPDGQGIYTGDKVYWMKNTSAEYDTFTWNGSAWTPFDPPITVGESFWSDKAQQNGYWKRVLWTWP